MKPWLGRLQLVTGILVVMAASVSVAWGLRRYLHHSPRFAIATVAVQGNQRLSPQQIAKSANIALGDNIFKLDEQRAQAIILADPWIESAKVVKELPDVVRVAVTEREAVVVASIEDKLVLVDYSGTLFKQVEPGDPGDLPVVTGIRGEELAKDREGVILRLRRVIDLLGELHKEQIAERLPIQELYLDAESNITVFAGGEGIALLFGQPPYRLKVQKAKRIFGELFARQVKPEVVFLDNRAHPERAVVRMRAENSLPRKATEQR